MATILRLDKGDQIEIKGIFTNASGVVVHPSSIWINWKDPDGISGSHVYGDGVCVLRGTGYAADFNVTKSGTWHFRVAASGNTPAAVESYAFVKESQF